MIFAQNKTYQFKSNAENNIFFLINEARAVQGLPYLSSFDMLADAANIRAKEIVANYSSRRPNGKSYTSLLDDNGIYYRRSKEILGKGRNNFQEIFDTWMSEYKQDLIMPSFTHVGVGYFKDAVNIEYYVLILISDKY